MKTLRETIYSYKDSKENVAARRKLWTLTTKQFIIDKLKNIQDAYGLTDTQVQELDFRTNYSGVNLTFNSTHSGISEHTEKTHKAFVKHGGTIVFHQSINGLVDVFIMPPYIEEIMKEPSSEVIATIEPDQVDEEFIEEQLIRFFSKLENFETGEEI